MTPREEAINKMQEIQNTYYQDSRDRTLDLIVLINEIYLSLGNCGSCEHQKNKTCQTFDIGYCPLDDSWYCADFKKSKIKKSIPEKQEGEGDRFFIHRRWLEQKNGSYYEYMEVSNMGDSKDRRTLINKPAWAGDHLLNIWCTYGEPTEENKCLTNT